MLLWEGCMPCNCVRPRSCRKKCRAGLLCRAHVPHLYALLAFPGTQDIFGLSSTYNTRPASDETINDPTNPEHYW